MGKNTANQPSTVTTTFRTQNLTLAEQTYPTLYPLKGSQVGVGMPVIVTFDVPVKNRREFEKNLHVTSSPAQEGSWHWYHSREVRFRPKNYWKPGTKVTVAANINGLNAGGGVYGQLSKKNPLHRRQIDDHQDQPVLRRGEGLSQWQVRPPHLCQRWKARLADPERRQADHGQALHHHG